MREDDWNVEEVDEVLEEDYVVHVDNAHTAPPPGPETLNDLELDVGPHDQQEPCFKYSTDLCRKKDCFAKHQPGVAGCDWLQPGRNFLST